MNWPFRKAPRIDRQLERMRRDWDSRARENARHYVATAREEWTDEDFFASGRQSVAEQILTDMTNICQEKDPREMRVLEIGCGAGRITRALAEVFGEVHAVDVSGEMIERARAALQTSPNAQVYQNNGMDLRVVPEVPFDFAFSVIVFQHIPSREIIENYVKEVHRLLGPGGLFKFQVLGGIGERHPKRRLAWARSGDPDPDQTWAGALFTEEDMRAMALRTGFECRYLHGADEQYFWAWFFKSAAV